MLFFNIVVGVRHQTENNIMQNYIQSKVNPRNPTTFTPYELGEFVRSIVRDCAAMVKTKHGTRCAVELQECLDRDAAQLRGLDISKASAPSR